MYPSTSTATLYWFSTLIIDNTVDVGCGQAMEGQEGDRFPRIRECVEGPLDGLSARLRSITREETIRFIVFLTEQEKNLETACIYTNVFFLEGDWKSSKEQRPHPQRVLDRIKQVKSLIHPDKLKQRFRPDNPEAFTSLADVTKEQVDTIYTRVDRAHMLAVHHDKGSKYFCSGPNTQPEAGAEIVYDEDAEEAQETGTQETGTQDGEYRSDEESDDSLPRRHTAKSSSTWTCGSEGVMYGFRVRLAIEEGEDGNCLANVDVVTQDTTSWEDILEVVCVGKPGDGRTLEIKRFPEMTSEFRTKGMAILLLVLQHLGTTNFRVTRSDPGPFFDDWPNVTGGIIEVGDDASTLWMLRAFGGIGNLFCVGGPFTSVGTPHNPFTDNVFDQARSAISLLKKILRQPGQRGRGARRAPGRGTPNTGTRRHFLVHTTPTTCSRLTPLVARALAQKILRDIATIVHI